MIWLFIYVLAISLIDLRTRRIPNWCIVPILATGIIAHFPGSLELWLACSLLLSVWARGWMGAGDVKLWMAVLWALPDEHSSQALLMLFISFLLSGLMQILWRVIQSRSIANSITPAAWRAIPFVLLCWYVH
jgi:prepilin peptidase CpaA